MSEFHIGQKVVYVGLRSQSTTDTSKSDKTPPLSRDEVYTVRWLGQSTFEEHQTPVPALRIVERVRVFAGYAQFNDWPYSPRSFRPLEKDTIEIFQQMCIDAGKQSEQSVK